MHFCFRPLLNFVRIFFNIRLFRQQFTIQTKIYRSHEYFVASARAPIVEGAIVKIYDSKISDEFDFGCNQTRTTGVICP